MGCLVLALPAAAHIEVGEKNLITQVAGAAVIVHARIEESGERFRSKEGSVSRPVVRARVIEVLKGASSFDTILFAQHGHGVAGYREGDEALLFLDPIETDQELGALVGLPGAPKWVSRQEHDDAYRLSAGTRTTLISAVRDLVRAQSPVIAPDPSSSEKVAGPTRAERRNLVRRATLRLLTSGDPRLGSAVLATLSALPGEPLIGEGDVPRLLAVVRDGSQSVGYRGALLAALESLALVDGVGEWRALVASASPARRPAALRAAGQSPQPAVAAFLIEVVAGEDPRMAEEAAIALGRPGRVAAVPALEEALGSDNARLRGAALRSLTAIGGPEALRVLQKAAESHADDAMRRRARAAVRRIGRPPAP